MKYKLIAIDMDGTFLNSEKKIPNENINAVKKAIEMGVKVIIATGRSGKSLVDYKEEISFNSPYIVYNGCGVKFLDTDDYLQRYDLDFEIAKEVYEFGIKNNLNILVWADDKLYASGDGKAHNFYRNHTGNQYTLFDDFNIFKDSGIHKVLFVDEPKVISEIHNKFVDSNFNKASFTVSLPQMFECFSIEGSKGNALLEYAKSLGIKKDEIIAIGDGMNDLSMIEAVGMGVAMGNAFDVVKESAKFITKTNDENGVAYAIEQLVLGEN